MKVMFVKRYRPTRGQSVPSGMRLAMNAALPSFRRAW